MYKNSYAGFVYNKADQSTFSRKLITDNYYDLSRNRSASSAAMQPEPAEVIA